MWQQKPGCRLCMTGQPAQIGGGRRRSTPPQPPAAMPPRGSPRRDSTGICVVPWSLWPGRSGRHGAHRRGGGGLRAQPEPLPGASLEAEATQRGQSQAKDTDGSGSGAMPMPAFPLEDAKALFNPDPQPIDFQRDRGRRLIREQDPGRRHLRAPHRHQGARMYRPP